MPADVAVRPPSHLLGGGAFAAERGGSGLASASATAAAAALAWSGEEACGVLTLAGPQAAPQEVLARVYRTSLEHFAVLYPAHRNVSRPLGVLSLRNTRVEPMGGPQRGFTVRQRAPDAPHALTFLCPEDAPAPVATSARATRELAAAAPAPSLEDWLLAFTWRGSPTLHATPLPAVQEDEEV